MKIRLHTKNRHLILAVSLRRDGSMGFITPQVNKHMVEKNRKRFFRALGVSSSRVVRAHLLHGNRVAVVRGRTGGRPNADALVMNQLGKFLAITIADCFPVFLYDRGFSTVGIAHAGWRGVTKGVVLKTVRAFSDAYAIRSRELRAVIGPGMHRCHFEITKEILPKFAQYAAYIHRRRGKIFVDLSGIIALQLEESGVSRNHIRMISSCTYHAPAHYFSYRRDHNSDFPNGFGSMIAVIGAQKRG